MTANGSEKDFMAQVVKLTGAFGGGWHFHNCVSIGSDPGFPDLFIPMPPVLRIWELKLDGKNLTERQQYVGDLISACKTIDYRVVRPADLPEIVKVLQGRRHEGD